VQLTQQVFFPDQPADRPEFTTCTEGLRELYAAVGNARQAAQQQLASELETANEEAALERYRIVLQPAWRHHDAVVVMCRSDSQNTRVLKVLRRLRYAEEHAVRSQGAELVALRRKARWMLRQVTESK